MPSGSYILKHLLRGETVFSIARIVHDVIADGKISAGIVTAAQGLGQITDGLLQEIDMGDVIQIDGGTDFCRIFEFMGRGIVEENIMSSPFTPIALLSISSVREEQSHPQP